MSQWEEKKLADLCSRIVSGGTPLKARPEFYENGTIPWLKTGEVKKNYVYETEEKITQQGLDNSSAKLIPKNSVIIAMYGDGDTAGNVAINKIPLSTNQACCNLILNEKIAFYRFIYFYLKGSYNNLVNLKLGGSQQNLNAKIIKDFSIRVPPLPVQRKIAAILSAYDDLIENCDRRITLLEKMAEEIYREWFVRLRFPGHEQTTFHKGIPEGWEVKQLQEIAKINAKSIRRGKEPKTIFYIDIASVTTNRIGKLEEIDFVDAPGRARRIVKHGDIIWSTVRPANRAYCLVLDPPNNLIASTGFAVITPSGNIPYSFLYWAVTSNAFVEHIANVAKGAAYPAADTKDFERTEILISSASLLEKFHTLSEPLLKQKHTLAKRSEVLQQTRDRLLTRLISGKLSVEDLDIQFPPSMVEDA